MRHALLAIALLASPLVAPLEAQGDAVAKTPVKAQPHSFAWVFDGGVEMGGALLLDITFTNGENQKIYAGQGGSVAFGVDVRPAAMPNVGIRALAGLKFTTTAAENANISFTRVPIEVVGSYYFAKDWRAGAGLAYHTAIDLNGDGFVPDATFDPAVGPTLELGWRWAALTYTSLNYALDGSDFDASSIGVSLSWLFGKR